LVGKTLGHYEILEPLGKGGMGEVYRARDTKLDRDVAIKVLPEDFATDQDRLARFEREAKLLAALNHPHIATIHGLEEDRGLRFLVMELIDGTSLTQKFRSGPLPASDALMIAAQVAQALEAAHREQIVHRDLKPDNVLLTSDGQVKLVDFGIAKESEAGRALAATEEVTNLTATGTIVGTPTYMSPEQIRGEPVDQRTDVWAFGCLLFEALAGRRVFGRSTIADTYSAIVSEEPDWGQLPESTSPTIRSLLRRCLTKDRERRLRDIRDARLEIEDVWEQPPGLDLRLPTAPSSTHTGWRTRIVVALGVVAIVVVGWTLWSGGWVADLVGPRGVVEGPPEVSVRQLTTTSGIDMGGTISDDGDWFAFTRLADNGTYSIRLQSIGARNAIPLVSDGVSPAFSSTGEWIAYSGPPVLMAGLYYSGGGISIMGRTGENVRRLTDEGFNPAWSPDETRIVYADEIGSWNPYSRQRNSTLHIVEIANGTTVTLDLQDAVQPTWSPDGHRIAYWGHINGQRDIWTVPGQRDDGDVVTQADAVAVTQDPWVDYSPVWSPDGRWLYFASTRGGSMAIWRVAIDEISGETLGEPQPITTGGLGDPGALSFSADGTRLLYTLTQTLGSIVAADFDPQALAFTSNPVPIVQGSRRLADPDVSVDGEWITYRTGGAQQDIFVARTNGFDEQQVTDDLFKDWSPHFSPDATKIAFYTNAGGGYEVWVMNRDGTGRTRLTETPEDSPQAPSWSPDGARISAFLTESRTAFILDTGKSFEEQTEDVLPPVPGGGNFMPWDWSPDGSSLVGIVAPAPGTTDAATIWRLNVENREYELLSEGGTQPAWMADSRRVLVRTVDPTGFYVVDSVTKAVLSVDVLPAEALAASTERAMVLSGDNLRAYLVQVEQESDIWMLELRSR